MNHLHRDIWTTQVRQLEEYHLNKYTEDKEWTFRKTAEELNRSLGSVSEDLRLSLALRIYPMLCEFHSKDSAMSWLRERGKCNIYSYRHWSEHQIQDILDYLRTELSNV